MFISIFLHPYMAPFDPLLRKNIIVWLNPPNFGRHSEDFRPILRIRKIPKIRGLLPRFFSLKISIKIRQFLEFNCHFHQIKKNSVYRCHTCMKSCKCQLNFSARMLGQVIFTKGLGLLSLKK